MKTLYEFEFPDVGTIKVEEETEDGILTKEEDTIIMIPMALKMPNRKEIQDAEMFYSVALSDCISKGIMTKSMLAKAYANKGGILTDEESKNYDNLYQDFTRTQFDYQAASAKLTMTDKSEEDQTELIQELADSSEAFWKSHQKIQDFENEQTSLFSQTAENIARNRVLLWLTVNLSYYKTEEAREEKDPWVPFFTGSEYEDKLDYYDIIVEDEDTFRKDVAEKFSILVAFWHSGRANTKEEFQFLFDALENLNDREEEDPEESEEETPDAIEEETETPAEEEDEGQGKESS